MMYHGKHLSVCLYYILKTLKQTLQQTRNRQHQLCLSVFLSFEVPCHSMIHKYGNIKVFFPVPWYKCSRVKLNPCCPLQIEFAVVMQAHELLKQMRIPELSEVRDYFRSLSTNTLLGMGAFTAVSAYWFATRPKALKAPCDLRMQSVELPVRQYYIKMNSKPVLLQSEIIWYKTLHLVFVDQGGEFARRGAVLNGGPLLSHFYEDAKTIYEWFHRGLRESSMYFLLLF